tara:strand:- start:506 stop:745 length:240 start_codon:yes stop_codon:yes gene_type:complete
MIDTDKYEGHTEGPWDADAPLGIYLKVGQTISAVDSQLIADAPLILEDYKRLREAIEYAIVHAENHDVIRVLDEVMEND